MCLIFNFFCCVFNMCLCVEGATFSVDGGQSKGPRSSALLRSPLFPPPLRNSPCTVSKSIVFSPQSKYRLHSQTCTYKHVIKCAQLAVYSASTLLVTTATSAEHSVCTRHVCSNMPDLPLKK